MGRKIRVLTGYSERRNCYYHRDFEIVDRIPEVGCNPPYSLQETITAIDEVRPDCEWRPRNDDDWNYDFYDVTTEYDEDHEDHWYIAVRRPEEEEEFDE